jgi:thiol-disulfide isomerase/thioredoxin
MRPHQKARTADDLRISRRTVIRGLAAAASLTASRSFAASEPPNNPPRFETGGYQFTILRPAKIVPAIPLTRLDGTTRDLMTLRGRVVLLNFWATWCAACRTELPILDRVQATMAETGLQVVAVSVDRGGGRAVEPYVRALNIRHVQIYLDPDGLLAHSDKENRVQAPFALYGMPISYLIDSAGRIVGYMPGAADWTSKAGQDLLRYYL